ncbi:MAG: DUF6541 family protein [Dysgonomonas sp.]
MKATDKIVDTITANKKLQLCLFIFGITIITLIMMVCYNPLFIGIDPYFNFNRLLVLMESIKDGNWLYHLDYNSINGYGYFTQAFYSDFLLIPFAIIGNLTNILFAYNVLLFSSNMLCGISMYISVKKIYNSTFCASVGAVLYTFCTYKIYLTFYNVALAEYISFIFIPIVFWGLYEIIKGDYKKWYIIALGFILTVFTHVITTVLLFIIILIFCIVYYKNLLSESKRIYALIIAGFSCFLICGLYLFPMLEQMVSNRFYYQINPHIDMSYHRMHFDELFQNLTNNLNRPFNIQRGQMGAFLLCMICLRLLIRERSEKLKSIDIGVIIGLFFIFSNSYLFTWNIFPLNKLEFIQFPWRLFKYSSYFFAVAGGFYLSILLKSDKQKILVLISISLFLIFTFYSDTKYYKNFLADFNNTEINENTIREGCQIAGAEYLPSKISSTDYFLKRGNKIESANTEISITNFNKNKGIINFNLKSEAFNTLELPLTYYKGYTATINNKKIPVSQSQNGLVEIATNESGQVKVWYEGTIVQKISPYVSLIGLIGLCVYIIRIRNNKKLKISTLIK